MIRIPNLPQAPGQQVNAPPASIEVANAPNIALGTLARSLASIGDGFQQHADQIQNMENVRLVSETRNRVAEEYARFSEELDKDPNPETRVEKTRAFWMKAKGIADRPDLPPAVRDSLVRWYEKAASESVISQGANAGRLSSKRALLALSNEIGSAKARHNREDLDAALATAKDSGILLPEEEQRIVQDFDRSVAAGKLDLAIQEDPALVLEDIERPDFIQRNPQFSPEDLPKIRRAAEAGAERIRGEELETLQEAMLRGMLKPSDLEAALYLKPSDRARFVRAMERAAAPKPQPLTSEEHARAWDHLLRLRESFKDPAVSDSDYAARFNDARAEVLEAIAHTPEAFRADITSELSRRAPGNRSAAKILPPVGTDKAELKAVALDRITRARAAGLFGNVADDAEPAEREKAYRRSEALRLQVSQWVNQNADKIGLPEIEEFTDNLISGDRVKSTARDLETFIPGSARKLRPVLPPLPGMAPGAGGASADLLPSKQLDTFLDQ